MIPYPHPKKYFGPSINLSATATPTSVLSKSPMASLLTLKRLLSSNLLAYCRRAARPALPAAHSAFRLFNTNAAPDFDDDHRRSNRSAFRLVQFSPISSSETYDGFYLRMAMPGLGKENVKVGVEQNTVIIQGGEGAKESDKEESGGRYKSRIDLPEKLYEIDQIKAEMKNGILKVVVPKVEEEENRYDENRYDEGYFPIDDVVDLFL